MRFIILASVCVLCVCLQSAEDVIIYLLSSIYYDPYSKQELRIVSIENVLMNNNYSTRTEIGRRPGNFVRKIGFRSNGCTCDQMGCGCCLGINIKNSNFKKEGCMNFTYQPDEFAVDMDMYIDGKKIFHRTFSARNPPPICIPVPIPYIPIQVETCAKLFNIYTMDINLHMCFDFETRIEGAAILVLHFDCMRLGNSGLALLKPEDGGGLKPSQTTEPTDTFDEITETKYTKKIQKLK